MRMTREARRVVGYGLAVVFASVGLIFLLIPGRVVALFNALSGPLGMRSTPPPALGLFGVLAVAYMAVVTLLAWNMGVQPENRLFPRILALAKISSALLSFLSFAVQGPFFILLVNGIVDGSIGVFVLWMSGSENRKAAGAPNGGSSTGR